uniref:Integration host factor subunit beta n=1 Tax=Magnetococcus massalia (strain MO-1) TaxID=451514 RepID=A0A1S7LFX1_MAGMO|nr:Integration host factor subunit beta [Candidatus Magnetococcus massalia]
MDAKGIIKQIARQHDMQPQQVEEVVEAFIASITDCLARGEPVQLPDFGQFGIKKVPPWLGRHPQTGEMVKLPGKHMPFFKSDTELRKSLNGGRDWHQPGAAEGDEE